ncbi:HYC_CC_PP family protein [Chitinophaga sancti]|uniref:Uncharacterized protein n=1 Tax=Chitinophaga sancti TaxID=1004 RepID=A0A1K1SFE8_9BACT|nr:hypothetical protein [Chitinophaga sancti]WQD59818.1 hypothetical protein U0033_18170 [Chitinophaga sancti]WQG88051.1 hypothetical protein SR876_24295 [Chitinophaga sancti]SFW83105.1 hypothetical protein SAMN05661012_05342 [Chitinophaga sancti]
MKKIVSLILAFLYVFSSTGATLHMHYCMGKLVDVKLWHVENKKCSKCVAVASKVCSKKCCKDAHKIVKLEKDQKAAENAFQFIQLDTVISPISLFKFPWRCAYSLAVEYPISNAPPRSSKVPPHILNSIFRI